MVDELVAFLRARLDKDEAIACAADTELSAVFIRIAVFDPEMAADERHIMRHKPVRVLREVEAKRRTVALYEEAVAGTHDASRTNAATWRPIVTVLEPVLRDLALPYADHPDYREEWRP
jgi:hypothetical protein